MNELETLKREIKELEQKLEGYEAFGIKFLTSDQIKQYDKIKKTLKRKWTQYHQWRNNNA